AETEGQVHGLRRQGQVPAARDRRADAEVRFSRGSQNRAVLRTAAKRPGWQLPLLPIPPPPTKEPAMGRCILFAAVLAASAPPASGAEPPANPRPANHLARESSPYLLQHAHTPVDWYPWGPEPFEKAKKEGKLVFLSVGYSACHWCHVMERESFANDEVAKLLNQWFVCIAVDREERPDIDQI